MLDPVSVEERPTMVSTRTRLITYPLWVAERRATGPSAWLSLESFLPRCAYRGTAEVSVYVDERFSATRIGQRSFAATLFVRAPALGINALVGHIFAQNEPSLKFFERAGFERWGYLPRVARLDNGRCDLVIVGRHIEQ